MSNKKIVILGLIGIIFGLLLGLLLILLLPKIPLSVENPIYKLLGIVKPRIIGFQPYWLLEKSDKNYDPYLTTYAYYGLALDNDGSIVKLSNPSEEDPGWTTIRGENLNKRLNLARAGNLNLSLLIYTSNESTISSLIRDPVKSAQNLISDISPIMEKYGFTDLNLDIESYKEATEGSRFQFTSLIRTIKKELVQNKLGTLTMDISPSALVKSYIINPEEIGQIADYVVLMTYDYHFSGSYIAGPVVPVGGIGKVREFDVKTSIKEALKVIPPNKIILGIPLYGYEWETISDTPGAAVIPGGSSTASNRRVAKLLSECNNCIKAADELSRETSIVFPDPDDKFFHQIFYEDENSLVEKVELAKQYKLSGVALWALGYEGDNLLNPLAEYKKIVEFKM